MKVDQANTVSVIANSEKSIVDLDMHRQQGQYGTTHGYAPIPIDTSHFDLGDMGWDSDFLSALGASTGDGFHEADLFC